MESCVYLTIEEYEHLKKEARMGGIPVEHTRKEFKVSDGPYVIHDVRINMKELKLRICEQLDISPNETIHFY